MTKTIKIDVWSDVACPWCYIGKRKLENAISQFAEQGGQVEVEYHSFLLNPDMPVDYEGSQREYLSQHKGIPLAQVEAMSDRVRGIAASVGLNYDFENQIMTNSILAHQLIQFAKTKGKEAEMKERLLAAHFVEAKHIGRVKVLADLAAEAGLDREEALAALANNAYMPAVEQDFATAREFGITGVPFFVIDNKYGISGAQDSSVFLGAFKQLLEEND